MVVKIEFTPLSLDRKIFPFKKGFKKTLIVILYHVYSCSTYFAHLLPASETAPPADLSEPPIFTKGKRNALNVIFNGFRHCKDGKHKESSYFRCVNQVPKCSDFQRL